MGGLSAQARARVVSATATPTGRGPAPSERPVAARVGRPLLRAPLRSAAPLQPAAPSDSGLSERGCRTVANWSVFGQGAVAEAIEYKAVNRGAPSPLGPSPTANGVNFAVFAAHASGVVLCVYGAEGEEMVEVPLDPHSHKTDGVWHVELEGLAKKGVRYGYKVFGDGGWESCERWDSSRVLLDPYAPYVAGRKKFATRDGEEHFEHKAGSRFLGTFDFTQPEYDWGRNYSRPNVPWNETVVYEMSVRCFTASESSGLPEGQRGTYKGLAKKADHIKGLGVTAVELLPVFEYDELEFQRTHNPREHMVNVWGYSHLNFFAPMSRFGSDAAGPLAAAREFKDMVKQLHSKGVEVILDVVYNHTAEGGDDDPYLVSFRGFGNSAYYMTDPHAYVQLLNYSGCGNTFNANEPVGQAMILDSLRRWVEEYHVDGFRFDLASCLCRDRHGNAMNAPPLIRAISKDPVLSQVKLIAEPWDIGMYQVGEFPNWDIWAEWNGRYRDVVRRFMKGDEGMKRAFATALSGSADLYNRNQRKPYSSVNFVTCHDGFTLNDLVSYNGKHNDANGEQGRDGCNDNHSWNCGHEGDTGDGGIKALRQRQMRNFIVALLVSQGTPMLLQGDEVCATRHGNNNWYGHDQPWTWMDWSAISSGEGPQAEFSRFVSEMVGLRASHPIFHSDHFWGHNNITWHEDNWDNPDSRFLAFTLHDHSGHDGPGDLYVAFNAHGFEINAPLPPAPHGRVWRRVVDTNLPPPRDITPQGNSGVDTHYGVQAHSAIVIRAFKE